MNNPTYTQEPFLMPNQGDAFNGDTFVCEEFLRLRDKWDISVALEFGSCVGGTTKWLSCNFERVVATEINADFRRWCLQRISEATNVDSILANTVDVLPGILKGCDKGQVMIFADDHWGAENPLLQELAIIADAGMRPVIAIHDFKVPDLPELGFDTYGGQDYEWSWIEASIERIYGKDGYTYHYNSEATGAMRGVVFIEPKN